MPRSLHRTTADIDLRATLAIDNFAGRSYKTNGIPAVCRGTDGAMRNAMTLTKDVKTLAKPGLKAGTRLAVASKVVTDADNIAFYGEMTVNGVRHAKHQAPISGSRALTQIHRAGALGNLVLAKTTLPSLAVTTVTKTGAAIRLSRDPHACTTDRREAWRDALYSQVGLVSMGSGVTGSISTLATTGSLASPLTQTAQALTTSDAFYVIDKTSRFLAPIADGAMLAADVLNLNLMLEDETATGAQKARAWFNVGIGTVKVATHFAPRSPVARTAYTVAGVVQLGLAGYDQVQYARAQRAAKRA
jgi:hypothetical protein